jgi:hypothetical protein
VGDRCDIQVPMMNVVRSSLSMRRNIMKWFGMLIVASAALVLASKTEAKDAPFVVHEWGTFTSVQGSSGIPIKWDPFVEDDLPSFVYSRTQPIKDSAYAKDLLALQMLSGKSRVSGWYQRMETPVIYFHGEPSKEITVRVDFPSGQISEWYPQVAAFGPHPKVGSLLSAEPKSFVEWRNLDFEESGAVDLPREGKANHYYAAREVASRPIVSSVGLHSGYEPESEQMLFYRGVGDFSAPLRLRFKADDQLRLSNVGKDAIRHLHVLEVRQGMGRMTKVASLEPSADKEITFPGSTPRPLSQLADELEYSLVAGLQESGLYLDEAQAMVNTWKDSWFEEDGTRVLYVLSRKWTDKILPIAIDPVPDELTRVMVGRAEILRPSVEREMRRLFDLAKQPEHRSKAVDGIRQLHLGRFEEPALRRTVDLEHRALLKHNRLLGGALSKSLETEIASNQALQPDLQSLQGTWEGFLVGNEADGKISLTITDDSLHFHRDTNHWFETTFTLPSGTDPQQLHTTIKRSSSPDLFGKAVVSLFKIEEGTLILAGAGDTAEDLPKIFGSEGVMRHEFRKVQPQKKNTEQPVPNDLE